jgi:putative endopeptidase
MNDMNYFNKGMVLALCVTGIDCRRSNAASSTQEEKVPAVPRFSLDYRDTSVEPGADFYRYAAGTWVKNNPVPADKSRWTSFILLQERNWYLIHQILDSTTTDAGHFQAPTRQVSDFFLSAMDTNRLNQLGFKPIQPALAQINAVKSPTELLALVSEFHQRGIGGCFGLSIEPDATNSALYALSLRQGGLSLPDRNYYLSENFAKQRAAYAVHVEKMFGLLGEAPAAARSHAATVLDLETALAKASKSRVALRDPIANYHKITVASLVTSYPDLPLGAYLTGLRQQSLTELVAGQPEFLAALGTLLKDRPLDDWKTYLRWHLVNSTASYLSAAFENESFAFYGVILRDQQEQEPRWQRAAHCIDSHIGEALGQLFVEKHFPPAARARMAELVENIKAVFRERLQRLEWMSEPTKAKALAKFARFTQKIGHPEKFRDYSALEIRPDDFLGNVQRAELFDSRRELGRVGKPVDRAEWHMTPQTVNAYFNPSMNEIVFPAGILQPPFFDPEMDDAVNYGAIGAVIGHEITHGYDDQGRKYDASGNLNEWWTKADAEAFNAQAKKVVEQYDIYEPLPGLHVNGQLTLGENIADLGGVSIAYEALERALAKDQARRKPIGGLTPEQRFFLSFSQLWRINCREAEVRRLVTVDPHSPGQFRAIGAQVNLQEFFDAYHIQPGAPMWRALDLRAKIW